ncbi:hypothetical protein [Raineyella sp. W15-4]|uniref:sunset domain-containing protein n=1 Tax=Raineyella sp. W15-4 TaxID=3081651 RepID=UPI002953EC9B|nr:hypothetical protein [Raineyella sp. W15-4]WOQ15885.1 hypothetical protein R0145_11700 [Raineyella sp. W15-4]
MKSNTQKVVIEAEVPKSLTEVGVDAVDAAIKAATPYLDQAREIGAARVADAQTRIAPFTATAQAKLAPFAEQARERGTQAQEILTEYAQEAQARLAPVAQEAQARLAPVAHEAKVRGVAGARGTLDTLAPRLEQALLAVGPLAEEAATRIKEDVVPRAEKFLDRAAEAVAAEAAAPEPEPAAVAPKGRKARKEAKAAAKLAKTQAKLAVAEEKLAARAGRKGGGTWKVLLILAGLIGIGILVAKKLGSPKEDAWQNYQPTPPAPAAPSAPAPAEQEAATEPDATEPDEMDDETAEVEAEMIGEGGAVTEADSTVSTDTATSYGADSYVGTEPPEGYVIKGNPRSMKYHLPGSDSYERTVTDVWFATEEAASAAGFIKATR